MSVPILPIAALLAQAKPYSPTPVLIWVGVLIACAMIGGTLVVILRRKMLDRQTASDANRSLMEHLRDAHARGEMSDAEYEQARKSIASRVSQVLDTKRAGGLFELPNPKRRPARPISPQLSADEPPKPALASPPSPEIRAPPGYDLTGAPLPKPLEPE